MINTQFSTASCLIRIAFAIVIISVAALWLSVHAQVAIRGTVLDASLREPLAGAHVIIAGTFAGTSADYDGNFEITIDRMPVQLVFSFVGYHADTLEITDPSIHYLVLLTSSSVLQEVVFVERRITDRQRESPLARITLDPQLIRQTPSHDFYEGIGALSGVDLITASLGFNIINTRGFASTSPVRTLQIIDGVDNQAPGLNFSLGNFLGAPELDVLRVELVQGPSSSFYGPNAFNGLIDIRTKDPFLHQGLDVSVKYGERNLFKGELRYASVFGKRPGHERFAFKVNLAYMRADDWEATNDDPVDSQARDRISAAGDKKYPSLILYNGRQHPGGYDAVNIYGDEGFGLSRFIGATERHDYPGLKTFYRRGYAETDLTDYNTENYKGNLGLYYRFNNTAQLSGRFNFGSGTTVYQGENRFRLKDIFFWQGVLEIRQEEKYFIRAYRTQEYAGKSYDIFGTALQMQHAAKPDNIWNTDYIQYWQTFIVRKVRRLPCYPIRNGGSFDFQQQEDCLSEYLDSLVVWHAAAQAYANSKTVRGQAFLEPGTAASDSVFHLITNSLANDPKNPGTRFYDKSALTHLQGEYQFHTSLGRITAGANFRQYDPDSRGTIFSDTSGVRIRNREFGIYTGADKDLIRDQLKFNLAVRLDKNQNYRPVVSPAASIVYVPDKNHMFRMSISSALRNPTLADQYLYLNAGRAQLLGNITGYDSLITPESFFKGIECHCQDSLVYFDVAPIRPERTQSLNIGYRGAPLRKLWIDAGYYFSRYRDFIGFVVGIDAKYNIWGFPQNMRIYRVSTNSESTVTTQGFDIGIQYLTGKYFSINGNYSWNILNKKGIDDPIIPAFNTPEHKFNIGMSGQGIPVRIVKDRGHNLGFNINYKWIDGYRYEGSPQYTGMIPAYDLLDAQMHWNIERRGLIVKLGATNVLNKKQFQVYGGPRIGRLGYLSILYQGKNL